MKNIHSLKTLFISFALFLLTFNSAIAETQIITQSQVAQVAQTAQTEEIAVASEVEVQQVWQEFQNEVEVLPVEEIQARLHDLADELELSDTDAAQQIRDLAVDPDVKVKLKKIGRFFKRAGHTVLFSLAIVGKTVSAITSSPGDITAGLYYGLKNGKVDKRDENGKNWSTTSFGGAFLIPVGVMILERILLGRSQFRLLVWVGLAGSVTGFIGGLPCYFPNKIVDPYVKSLCRIEKYYHSLTTAGTSQGASWVGAKIHQGVKWTVRKIRRKENTPSRPVDDSGPNRRLP